MQYSEDSVVVALDEVRRLRHRADRASERRDVSRDPRPTPVVTQAFAGWSAPPAVGTARALDVPAYADPASSSPDYQALAAAAGLRRSGGTGRVFLLLLLFGGIGAGGYFAYQEHLTAQATIVSRDAALRRAEETARQAIEDRSRAERQAAAKVTALEEKLAAVEARLAQAIAVPAPVAAPAPPPAPAPRHTRAAAEPKPTKRPARELAKVDAKPAKPARIVPKRTVSDDPLAGLKLR